MAKTSERLHLANLQQPSLLRVAEQPKELDFILALEGVRGPCVWKVGSQTLFSLSLCSMVKGGLLSKAFSEVDFGPEAGLGLGLPAARRLADCRTASECSRAFMRRAATLAVRLL